MDDPKNQYPAVIFAYDFVKPSYDWLVSRMEASVTRSQSILTIATTMTFGVPVLGAALNKMICFRSGWFAMAMASFFVLVIFGILARHTGEILLVSPSKLYQSCTHMSEWQFKHYMLYYAGEAFEKNMAVIGRKMQFGTWMSGLLIVEAILFLIWIATQV